MASVIGQPCPSISGLTWVRGGPVQVGEVGVVAVVEFWATWCPPCRDSIPHLTQLQSQYKDKGVHVIGITSEQDVSVVRKFVEGMGSKMDYAVAVDSAGTAQQLMVMAGARGIPHAFVLDHTARIAFSGHPSDPSFDTALREAVRNAPPASPGSTANASAAEPSGGGGEKQALPVVTQTYEELMGMSIKALKTLLSERGVRCEDCLYKADLAQRIIERCANVVYYR